VPPVDVAAPEPLLWPAFDELPLDPPVELEPPPVPG